MDLCHSPGPRPIPPTFLPQGLLSTSLSLAKVFGVTHAGQSESRFLQSQRFCSQGWGIRDGPGSGVRNGRWGGGRQSDWVLLHPPQTSVHSWTEKGGVALPSLEKSTTDKNSSLASYSFCCQQAERTAFLSSSNEHFLTLALFNPILGSLKVHFSIFK